MLCLRGAHLLRGSPRRVRPASKLRRRAMPSIPMQRIESASSDCHNSRYQLPTASTIRDRHPPGRQGGDTLIVCFLLTKCGQNVGKTRFNENARARDPRNCGDLGPFKLDATAGVEPATRPGMNRCPGPPGSPRYTATVTALTSSCPVSYALFRDATADDASAGSGIVARSASTETVGTASSGK